jgi:hypothetical protein
MCLCLCLCCLLVWVQDAPHPPVSGAGAVGWRIKLYWAADAGWHEAEVLSYDESRHRHHLLYLDGEDEWTDLARETVRWLKATRHGAISAGRVAGGPGGTPPPQGLSCGSG